MKKEKRRGLPLKEILFGYLALSKILYWIDMIAGAEQGDFRNAAGAVWIRLIDRDILLVIIVILFVFLEKLLMKKFKVNGILKHVLLYVIGYVGMIGLFYMYSGVLSLFFSVDFPPLMETIVNNVVWYITVIITLEIKVYFKTKTKPDYDSAAQSAEGEASESLVPSFTDKLAMLKSMLDDGILTQAEFDRKKERVLSEGN